MRRISSKTTFLHKRIFPVFWFGLLAIFVAVALIAGPGDPSQLPIFLIVPIFMGGFGYFIMKKLVFDLVDEVWDDGTSLLIRNRGQEDRVRLSDIMNVSYSPLINPPRVTLMLRKPSSSEPKSRSARRFASSRLRRARWSRT